MPTRILIPTPLRPYTGASAAVEVDGANVGELLRALIARHGDLKAHLFHDDGRLRHFVNIYLNDEDIRYLEGERTPNLPTATGRFDGLTLTNATPAHLARAAVEGLLCGLADGLDALVATGVTPRRVILVGGGAASEAVRRIAPTVLAVPVEVPQPGEYVADGAARQAAWALSGGEEPPAWSTGDAATYTGAVVPAVRERYAKARDDVARALG